MPLRITGATAMDSFEQLITLAAQNATNYLHLIAQGARTLNIPVRLHEATIVVGDIRNAPVTCLIVQPARRRLRHFRTAHYALIRGPDLQVGWYLTGAEKAAGIGWFGIGAASQSDITEVSSIVQTLHRTAVAHAIAEITRNPEALAQTRKL